MAWFRYKLIDSSGRPRGGLIDLPFENPMSAMTYLERQGGTVIFAQPLPRLLGIIVGFLKGLVEKPIKPDDIVEGLTNFSVMIRSGLPAITAIEDSFAQSDNPSVQRMGREIITRVENGASLSASFSAYKAFPSTVGFLLRVGEESGTLDRTTRDAASHVRRVNQIKQDIRRALTYPMFMISAILGALIFWIVMVVPVVTDLFDAMDVDLPMLTIIIIETSDWMATYYLPFLVGVVGVIVGAVAAIKTVQPVRKLWHKMVLRTPVFGNVVMTSNVAFITEYLSLMLNAGVDMMTSLQTLRASVSNEVYKERLTTVGEELVAGRPLRDSFETAGVFPPFVQRMVGVGEESGQLTDQLRYVAEEYEQRLNNMVAGLSKVIEPIALAIGGGLFILMVVGLFLPIFDLIAEVGDTM